MRIRLLLPVLIVCGLLLGGCGENRELAHRMVQVNALERQVGDLQAALAASDAELAKLRNRPEPEPEPQPDEADDLNRQLAGSGANAEIRGGEVVITVTNDILFRPGSAKLSANARQSLDIVTRVIRENYPGQYVRVEGHTDSQPIRRSKDKWNDNWDLAGGRARAVLHGLMERGISRDLISFAGYADTRPVANNNSDSGRKQNRRVGIVVLPVR